MAACSGQMKSIVDSRDGWRWTSWNLVKVRDKWLWYYVKINLYIYIERERERERERVEVRKVIWFGSNVLL